MKKQLVLENIVLDKFVHGGQCLAKAPDGRKLFVWGGLPGEVVDVRITKKKSSYLEGVVVTVYSASADRVDPVEPDTYLSSSPWQIMNFEAENSSKQSILEEVFSREGIKDQSWQKFYAGDQEYGYRNKVEFGFWGDDEGIHLAQYVRGTHGKQIITGNALAGDNINYAAKQFIIELNRWSAKLGLRAGDFKTVVLRASQSGEVAAALYMKQDIDCSGLSLPACLKGLVVYFSNPKSPASVPTREIYALGDITLHDALMGKNIMYDVLSFFQVNLPVFEAALNVISKQVNGRPAIDLYSGVGTIGITVGANILIEADDMNAAMALKNTQNSAIRVVHAPAESALDHITREFLLIVDPPRAGLHKSLVLTILDRLPPQIIYLSCNPSTQARDVMQLSEKYTIKYAQGYNFFPRTPHIESLVVLQLI